MRANFTRRAFLKGLGMGAAGAVAVGANAGRVLDPWADDLTVTGNFGRLFPNLPPFFGTAPSASLLDALRDIGKPGGMLDANDALSAGPIALITDPLVNGNNPPTNPDNPTHTAGTHFMGQFMDHDMTFDTTSQLGVPTDPTTSPNSRIPYFDLDSVYGAGPIANPQFYDPGDRVKLKIESGGLFEDLPRASDGTAILPDPRNDENLIIAGLQCAFILFHNHAVDYARSVEGLTDSAAIFQEARRLTTWHYQWMILHEFLPLFVGQSMVDDIVANGLQIYHPRLGQAVMPVEFQGASYRFGHSMVRPSYRANMHGIINSDGTSSPFFGFIFDPSQNSATADPSDLRGGFRAPRRFIGWQTFFDFGDGNVRRNKRIDTRISTPLFNLPLPAIASHQPPTALPQRNLLRQVTWSLPSGQSIAQQMGVSPLTISDLSGYGLGLDTSTPLWFYVLKEAELLGTVDGLPGAGYHLGPVGGRIVGEVIIGLLRSDPNSYLSLQRKWVPTLPVRDASLGFRMVDFLTFAGVDPTSRLPLG